MQTDRRRVQVQEHSIYPLVVQWWFCEGRLQMREGLPSSMASSLAWQAMPAVTASSSKTQQGAQASLVIPIDQRNGCHHVR